MAEDITCFSWTSKIAHVALMTTLGFLGLLLVGIVALTSVQLLASWSLTVLLGGIGQILAVVIGGIWLFVVYGIIRIIEANEDSVSRAVGRLGRIEALLQSQAKANHQLIRLVSLSDQTKGLVFREREVEALRDAFHDSVMRQDYPAAEVLIESLRRRPDLQTEADRMQEELDNSKVSSEKDKIDSAVARVGEIIKTKDWPRALRTVQKLLQLFPDSPQVRDLPGRIETAKTRRKRELLHEYDAAVRKNDVDRSIDLLKKLDSYLGPQEAAALEESARGIFRAKLHNLGVQFALSVTDEQWAEAIAVGEQIAKEYPNSRMANEVRQKMAQLQARATAPPQTKQA